MLLRLKLTEEKKKVSKNDDEKADFSAKLKHSAQKYLARHLRTKAQIACVMGQMAGNTDEDNVLKKKLGHRADDEAPDDNFLST